MKNFFRKSFGNLVIMAGYTCYFAGGLIAISMFWYDRKSAPPFVIASICSSIAFLTGYFFAGAGEAMTKDAENRKENNPPSSGHFPETMAFPIVTVDHADEMDFGRWFRLRHWRSDNFVMIKFPVPPGWKVLADQEKVAGVTFENRHLNFFRICLQPGFRIYLQREEDNAVDPYALRVMGTCDTLPYGYHIGYLEKEAARSLKNHHHLQAIPQSAWLPTRDCGFGLRITVLTPSGKLPPPLLT